MAGPLPRSVAKELLLEAHAGPALPELQCVGVIHRENKVVLGLSDGEYWIRALAEQRVLRQVEAGEVELGTKLRLKVYRVAFVTETRVLVVSDAEILGQAAVEGAPEKLVVSVPLTSAAGPSASHAEPADQPEHSRRATSQPQAGSTPQHEAELDFLSHPGLAANGHAPGHGTDAGGGTAHANGAPADRHGDPGAAQDPGPAQPVASIASPREGHWDEPSAAPGAPRKPPAPPGRFELDAFNAQPAGGGPPARRALNFGAGPSSGRTAGLRLERAPDPPDSAALRGPAAFLPQPAVAPAAGLVEPPANPGRSPSGIKLLPIGALSPWTGRAWAIKARVLGCSGLRSWERAGRSGSLFDCQLVDAAGTELRAAAFNGEAERLQPLLVPGAVVFVERGTIKPAGRGSGFEVVFNESTRVMPCPGDDIPVRIHYRFLSSLAAVEPQPLHAFVDVVGIVAAAGPATTVATKYSSEVRKRAVTLLDESRCSVELTLWDAPADETGAQLEQMLAANPATKPVLAAKAARVAEWFGPTLSTAQRQTMLQIDPEHPRATALREWYFAVGSSLEPSQIRNLSRNPGTQLGEVRRLTIAEALGAKLDEGSTATYTICGVITFMDKECVYPACSRDAPAAPGDSQPGSPGPRLPRRCQKKLREDAEGAWFCETCCDRSPPEWRYKAEIVFQDHTGQLKCVAFAGAGDELLGVGAPRVRELQADPEQAEAADLICLSQHGRRLMARLRATQRVWNNVPSLQFVLQHVWPVDYNADSKTLLQLIGGLTPANAQH